MRRGRFGVGRLVCRSRGGALVRLVGLRAIVCGSCRMKGRFGLCLVFFEAERISLAGSIRQTMKSALTRSQAVSGRQ